MNITIIGTGYVGLVSGICFSEFGFNVTCVDKDKHKIQDLKDGKVTLPLIIAVSSSSKSNYMKAETILKTRKFDRKSLNFLYNLIVQEGALDKAKKEAEKYSKKALNNVKHLKNSEYKIALQYLLIGNLTRIN